MAFYDTNWGYGAPSAAVPLFDDGPWTAGGHEGEGSVAGDHKWGATIFVPTPTAEETWNYGLADAAFGFGWIWVGNAGAVTIPASSTTPIVATGQTFPPFGTIDLKLQVDLAALDPQFLASTVDLTQPKVKGSKWAWTLIPLTAEGGGIYTFLMSDFVGPGKEFSHTGLGETGDQIQFVFTFGATDKEYKVGSSGPPISGVTAWTSPTPGGTLSSASIQKQPSGDQNTFVTLP
jgi:hypothetical protein